MELSGGWGHLDGGDLSITSGVGETKHAGSLLIQGGASPEGSGGDVTVEPGSSENGDAGSLLLTGGRGATSSVKLLGGDSFADRNGGEFCWRCYYDVVYYTLSLITIIFSFTHTLSYLFFICVCLGMVLVESGYNTNSGTSGKVLVTTSDTTDESSGSTSIATGSSSHDNSGTVSLSTGESGTNYSGDVRVYSSDGRRGSGVVSISTGASNDKVGDISLTTGKVMRSIYSLSLIHI